MSVNSSLLLDAADEAIVVPKVEDVRLVGDGIDYMSKLDEIQDPSDRLIILAKSLLGNDESTLEAEWLTRLCVVGTASGLVYGGVLSSGDVQERYIRKHNAEVFDGKYRANRHFWDTLVTGCLSKGLSYGVKAGLLSSAAGMIGICSITYRDRLYLPDWMVGFTALGVTSRLWLGYRGAVAGAAFGLTAGLLGFSMVKLSELFTGYSVIQMRQLSHHEWLQKRKARLRKFQVKNEEATIEFMSRVT